MRATRVLVLGLVLLVPTLGASAAPQRAQSISPIVGTWTKDGASVLRVRWDPRGLHGPKTAEIYADVISDFRFFSDGCLHRAGERLFEVNSVAAWPHSFEGTGVVLAGDTSYSSSCASVGSKVTVAVGTFTSTSPPKYGLDICFYPTNGHAVCSSTLERTAAPGETVATAERGYYVAPGKFQASKGLGVKFVVTAGGGLTEPSGRAIADLTASVPKATCSQWSVAGKRWLKVGKPVATTVTVKGPITLGTSTSVQGTWRTGTSRTIDLIQLSASFADWTHLSGSIRAVHYTYRGAQPKNPDKPGKTAATRCDSGTTTFTSEHVPGSWQEIAGGGA